MSVDSFSLALFWAFDISTDVAYNRVSLNKLISSLGLDIQPDEVRPTVHHADGAADYWVFVNAKSGETEQLLRVIATEQGEAAM